MLALREVQTALRSALLGRDDALARRLVHPDGLAPGARIEIYRHHVETTLADVLAATFPVARRLVDPRFFAYAADRYLREDPPTSPCLFEYGVTFPDFLAAFPACRHLSYLPDVARVEWALHAAFHADDVPPLDPSRLGGIAPGAAGRLVLRLDPSVTFLRSVWPVDEIWAAHQPDGHPESVRLAVGDVRLEVRRRGEEVGFRRTPRGEFAFRRALAAGACLERAAGVALAEDPAFELVAALAALLRDASVVGFEIQDPEGGRS